MGDRRFALDQGCPKVTIFHHFHRQTIIAAILAAILVFLVMWAEIHDCKKHHISHSAALHEAGRIALEKIDVDAADGKLPTHPKTLVEAVALLKERNRELSAKLESASQENERLKRIAFEYDASSPLYRLAGERLTKN
jgi:hypothetical protein